MLGKLSPPLVTHAPSPHTNFNSFPTIWVPWVRAQNNDVLKLEETVIKYFLKLETEMPCVGKLKTTVLNVIEYGYGSRSQKSKG